MRKTREEHLAKRRERSKVYYAARRELRLAQQKKRREDLRDDPAAAAEYYAGKRAASKRYYDANRDKEADRQRRYVAANPEKRRETKRRYMAAKPETDRAWKLSWFYGMTLEDYERLLAAQGNACAICKTDAGTQSHGRLQVDHCHSTGEVRGLLCGRCNRGLGMFSDSPDALKAALRYLDKAAPVKIAA